MSDELRDVLMGAERATAQALPGFDDAVLARTATKRSRRRRVVRSAGTVAAAVVAVAALGTGGVFAADYLSRDPGVGPVPTPSVTATPVPSETEAPVDDAPLPGHTVTVADGLPSAKALSQGALDAIGTDWVLTVFDSTFRRSGGSNIDGERVLYLVSPAGERYEVANMTAYDGLYLMAWDTERNVAFFTEDSAMSVVVDIASGKVTHEWEYCGEGSWLAVEAVDGGWGLHGSCIGEPLDGTYDDSGKLLSRDGYFQSTFGTTVTLVGSTQVVYEFERPPAQKFRAVARDGSVTPLAVPSDTPDCYPYGAADDAMVIKCWGEGEGPALWSVPLDGSAATILAGPAFLTDLGLTPGGDGLEPDFVGYCQSGDLRVVSATPSTVLVLRGDGDADFVPNDGEYVAVQCYPAASGLVVVSGVGPLWSWDPNTDRIVELMPVNEPSDDGIWVGANENGVIVHP